MYTVYTITRRYYGLHYIDAYNRVDKSLSYETAYNAAYIHTQCTGQDTFVCTDVEYDIMMHELNCADVVI